MTVHQSSDCSAVRCMREKGREHAHWKPRSMFGQVTRRSFLVLIALTLGAVGGCSEQRLTSAPEDPVQTPRFSVTEADGEFVYIDSFEEDFEAEGYDDEMPGYVCPSRIYGGWRLDLSGPFGTKRFLVIGAGIREGLPDNTGPYPKARYSLPGRRYATDWNTWIEGLKVTGTCKFVWNESGTYINVRRAIEWDRGSATITRWGRDSDSNGGGSCDGMDANTRRVYYDPYSEEPQSCTGGDGSGSGGGGSGTQYYPGDSTGGETVDWGTGRGNGGVSKCGASAVVEYICIDYWDGQRWVEWSCGYATTC